MIADMIERDLKDITEADLQKLIADPVREGKGIEYKSELNLKTDEAKRKFLAGIASFANASGGDMVIGMKTDRTDKGRPFSIQPLASFNSDGDILMLRDIIRAHIEPKVFTVDFKTVDLAGGYALVIRTRKTWAGAHMVTYNNDFRFYTRDLAGRRLMDVPEIRAAFTFAEATVEKVNRFRLERLANIVAGETPFPLDGTAVIVIHLCPLRSFEPGFRCDLSSLRHAPNTLPPLYAAGWSHSDDFDGFFTYAGDIKGKTTGYCFVFRNGCFEAADTHLLSPRDAKTFFPSIAYEQRILEAVPRWFQVLKRVGAEPPVIVMLSLLGVNGYWMYTDPGVGWYGARAINRDQLILPGALVESLDLEANGRTTKHNVFDLMRPMFDQIWNACGYPRSINFDEAGNWRAHR
jgi:Putative DNA-binding domain